MATNYSWGRLTRWQKKPLKTKEVTPKQKALELIERFEYDGITPMLRLEIILAEDIAKQCALICVEEILGNTGCGCCADIDAKYWVKVKREIELL